MKKLIAALLSVSLLLLTAACSAKQPAEQITNQKAPSSAAAETGAATETEETAPKPAEEPQQKEEEAMNEAQFYITANGTAFTANFVDNESADAFRELLREGDLTVDMSDYGSFEKVGSIGTALPSNDTQISTTTGDVMLYQGDQVVIFYGTNSWSYSRLGKIESADAEALLSAFGSGAVTVTFSLAKPQ